MGNHKGVRVYKYYLMRAMAVDVKQIAAEAAPTIVRNSCL